MKTVTTVHDLSSAEINTMFDEVKGMIKELIQKYDPKSPDEFMSREETAKTLKISLPTLSALSKEGVIPSYRLGGRVLYKSTEVAMALTKVITK